MQRKEMDRGAGVLMPVFSLPCKYSIGSFGRGAYRFVDFLKKASQKYWQVLPLVQTGYSDSPYQSVCDASLNPYFLDLELLSDEGLLTRREVMAAIDRSDRIDYGKLYNTRYKLLEKAFSRFDINEKKFKAFLRKGEYNDYALFMTLKNVFGQSFDKWDNKYKFRDAVALNAFKRAHKREYLFWQFVQYKLSGQWRALKAYANKNGIKIIGDLPLYVAYDSVDVWARPENFLLDEDLKSKSVAGVPPDYFSEDGQLWGNPLYDYSFQREHGFDFWKSRLKHALKLFDYVRIDHFRGLDRFYSVPVGSKNAKQGEWLEGPKDEIFSEIDLSRIIAEDLGIIDEDVKKLLKKTGCPGMKVLSFAFTGDIENPYLPWNVGENTVYYTGTHDNDTVMGQIEEMSPDDYELLAERLSACLEFREIHKKVTGKRSAVDAFIDIVYSSRSNCCIVPFQDVLQLGTNYRVNEPGTEEFNWMVKFGLRRLTSVAAEYLARKVKRFER